MKERGKIIEKAKEGVGGRAFSSQPYTVSSKRLSSALTSTAQVEKPFYISTHTHTHTHAHTNTQSSCQKVSFDSNQETTFWHQTKPFFINVVATGNCLKRHVENSERFPLIIAKMSITSQMNIEASACKTKPKLKDLFSFCLQEIEGPLTKVSQY